MYLNVNSNTRNFMLYTYFLIHHQTEKKTRNITYLLVVYSFTYLHFLPRLRFTVTVTLGCFTVILILLVSVFDSEVYPVLICLIFILLSYQSGTSLYFGNLVFLLDRNVVSLVSATSRCTGCLSLLPGGVNDSGIRNTSTCNRKLLLEPFNHNYFNS